LTSDRKTGTEVVLPATDTDRFAKILLMLSSGHKGERLAAVAAINRTLERKRFGTPVHLFRQSLWSWMRRF
jgi:hypothetical protein